MLVSVTGGTGFVGAHSVAAIVRSGNRVRLLARDRARVDRALAPLGVDGAAVEVVEGDILDESAVAAAVRDAEGVLHAASVYSFDSRQRANMRRVNARGTDVVLAAALRAGATTVVHVSSIVAMFPAENRVMTADSPVGTARDAYMATKAAAETIARGYQAHGEPVTITYPPALLGPHDPHLGDQTTRLRNVLRGLMPMWPLGGFPVGDVRDTAALHAALFTDGAPGGGRFFGPNHYLSTREYVRTLREVTGRALPTVYLPARAMAPVGRLVDGAQRVWPWHLPAEYGAIYTCGCAARVADDADTHGVAARPVAETMADTVRWLREHGDLTARQSGRAAARADGAEAGGAAGRPVEGARDTAGSQR